MIDPDTHKSSPRGSEASESTLVEEPPAYSEHTVQGSLPDSRSEKTPETTNDLLEDVFIQDDDAIMVNSEKLSPPPSEKPPPIPARNKPGLSIKTNTQRSDTDLLSFGSQQDVTEVINNVEWRLSCAIKPNSIDRDSGEQIDNIRDTFFGANAVYTQKAHITERKVESWQQLIVFPHATGPRSIYEALDVVFDEQAVQVENTMIPQFVSITELPPVLQIHIQRTDFDQVKKEGFKNRNQVTTPETIYMDRYMDTKDPVLLRRRRDAWKWKAQLRSLEVRQAALSETQAKMSVPDALLETKKFITELQECDVDGLEVDNELMEALDQRLVEVAAELDELSSRIRSIKQKLTEQFTDLTQYEYKLQTVFIHRGETGGGHYWIYLYDFEKDIWREYNDDHVSIVSDRNRIFNHDPQAGTPYYLAYIRSADKQDLVDAVVREIAVENEVEMIDVQNLPVDESIVMIDDLEEEFPETRHIEHVQPRPILPKPHTQPWNTWENVELSGTDANGRKWSDNDPVLELSR